MKGFRVLKFRDKEPKRTKLELEIRQCSHMMLDSENLKNSWIYLSAENVTKIEDTKAPHHTSEVIDTRELLHISEVICEITGEPCVFYNPGNANINYHHLGRCPSSEESVKKYKLKGTKEGPMFHVSNMERVEG
jgi:hypothetical protein